MPVPPQDNHQPPIPQEPQPPNLAQPSRDEGHHVDMDIHEGHHGADYHDINMDEHPRQPSPQADVHTEFVGCGDHLYRNYHTGLSGKLIY
jgi:hypothetical protein